MPLDREHNIMLLDYYGNLLTKHQQEVYEACVYEDLSLAEAAERQVGNIVHRGEPDDTIFLRPERIIMGCHPCKNGKEWSRY